MMLLNPYRYDSGPPPPPVGDVTLLLHFDETSGSTFLDTSTYGWEHTTAVATINGTSSGPRWGAGCCSISNGYIAYPDFVDNWRFHDDSDTTFEFWANFSALSDVMVMGVLNTTSGNYEWIFTLYEGSPSLLIYDTSSGIYFVEDLTFTFSTSTWYFIQFTKDGSDLKLWVNGALRATVPFTTGFKRETGARFVIGRGFDFYSTPLSCKLDELRVTQGGVQSSAVPTGPFPNPT